MIGELTDEIGTVIQYSYLQSKKIRKVLLNKDFKLKRYKTLLLTKQQKDGTSEFS